MADGSANNQPASEETLLDIRSELERQLEISSTIGLEEKDRGEALSALKEQVVSWKKQEEKKEVLQNRLHSIEKKILVGGVNLLDKSQTQEALLVKSMQALEEKREAELALRGKVKLQEVSFSAHVNFCDLLDL